MKTMIAVLLILSLAVPVKADATKEQRCGWFENPSPSNAYLIDRDGTWDIAIQGMHQATGDWPQFSDDQWVKHGIASYGHGCSCIVGYYDHATNEVREITQSTSKPLSTCRNDRSLENKEPTRE